MGALAGIGSNRWRRQREGATARHHRSRRRSSPDHSYELRHPALVGYALQNKLEVANSVLLQRTRLNGGSEKPHPRHVRAVSPDLFAGNRSRISKALAECDSGKKLFLMRLEIF